MSHARVSAAEAQRLLAEQAYVYLDVRSEQEFALGHPLGAYNVPLRVRQGERLVDNPHFMAVVQGCFDPGQRLVVGCERGDRSRTAAQHLIACGYLEVVEARAGYAGIRDPFGRSLELGWRNCGLPSATEPEPGRDYRALLERYRMASGKGAPGRANK